MHEDLPNQISKSKPIAAHEGAEKGKLDDDKKKSVKEREEKVDEALDESFPASDPPAFNKTTAGGGAD